MKINILYKIKEGPWGGGNSFLRSLRKELRTKGLYVENAKDADVLLFNLNPDSLSELRELHRIKNGPKNPIIIGRIDGPIYQIRERDLIVDNIFYRLIENVLDGIVYQSEWSQNKNHGQGIGRQKHETVIHNASDSSVFFAAENKTLGNKTKLLCTSWSENLKKGFDVYKWMDDNLDFERFEFEFVGNSPYKFKNIKTLAPLPHDQLVKHLQGADVFITASQKDPCSNSLIEGLSCGLPALVLNDGGHPELVKKGGLVFDGVKDIPDLLDDMVQNYNDYRDNIDVLDFSDAAEAYSSFARNIMESTGDPKKFSFTEYAIIQCMMLSWYAQRARRKFLSS